MTVHQKTMTDTWLQGMSKRNPISLAIVQCKGDKLSENALRQFFKHLSPKLKACTEHSLFNLWWFPLVFVFVYFSISFPFFFFYCFIFI